MASKREREADEFRRRKLARQRMRSLIRSVMFNRIWLQDTGDQKLSLNVKKNIAMLIRTQRKIGILTLADKALIRSHHSYRTVEDRKKLVSLLAGLTCFSKLPPKVRARLVPIISFMYLQSGRTIIRENSYPDTIYFILTGEVEVTKRVFDPLKKVYTDKVDIISGPGDCLGDFELIENIPRTCTCTTLNDVELLFLSRDDFNDVLRPTMAKQWFDKKTAILTLGYFSYLNKEQLINSTKVAVLRQFEPLETIYHEDTGHLSYVHFVISGECMILQCLRMKVRQKRGKKTFQMVDISKEDGDLFQELTDKDQINQINVGEADSKATFDIEKLIASNESVQKEGSINPKFLMQKMDIKSIEISCGLRKPSGETLRSHTSGNSLHPSYNEDHLTELKANNLSENGEHDTMSDVNGYDIDKTPEAERTKSSTDNMEGIEDIEKEAVATIQNSDSKNEIFENADNRISTETIGNTKSKSSIRQLNAEENAVENAEVNAEENAAENAVENAVENAEENAEENAKENAKENPEENPEENAEKRSPSEHKDQDNNIVQEDLKSISKPNSQETLIESIHMTPTGSGIQLPILDDSKIENHFIDVGSITFGGIFGLGEKLEHRVIMARTSVQCLMIPRFWLFEKERNPGNIWQRRRFYLDSTIPSRHVLFKDFLITRKWQQFKNELIESNVGPTSRCNPTKVQDIPIICRIVEANDD